MLTFVLWAAMLPPRLMEIRNSGCTVVQVDNRWKLLVWVLYDDGQGWASWHGKAKDPNKLGIACDSWLEGVEHATKGRA